MMSTTPVLRDRLQHRSDHTGLVRRLCNLEPQEWSSGVALAFCHSLEDPGHGECSGRYTVPATRLGETRPPCPLPHGIGGYLPLLLPFSLSLRKAFSLGRLRSVPRGPLFLLLLFPRRPPCSSLCSSLLLLLLLLFPRRPPRNSLLLLPHRPPCSTFLFCSPLPL